MSMNTKTTGDVVREFSVTARQLIYWNRIGLFCPSLKSPGGYFRYTTEDLVWLRLILALKEAGVSVQRLRITVPRIRQIFASIPGISAALEMGGQFPPEDVKMAEAKFRLLFRWMQVRAYRIAKEKGFHDRDETRDEISSCLARIALIHSEASEALEIVRQPDPDWMAFALELADIVIRVMDLAEMRNLDLGDAIVTKMRRNAERPPMHGKTI